MGVYRFGEFRLDTTSGDLRKGRRSVRLRPQPTAALAHLLEHPGEVVTREEFRRVLWGDATFVHFDHGLNSCIKQIRNALSDSRTAPRYVETLPRRGYRFIEAVSLDDTPSPELPAGGLALSGRVQVNGRRVEIAICLKDALDADRVWSARFERQLDEGRGSDEEVASSILHRLVRGEPL